MQRQKEANLQFQCVNFLQNMQITKKILQQNNLNPHETLFIDDREPYIIAAKKIGIKTLLFEDTLKLKEDLKSKFNIYS